MTAALQKSHQVTLKDSSNATFSLELVDGQWPLDLPVGQTIDLFGQDRHLASLLVQPEAKREAQTSDIFGQCSSISLKSKHLQQSLVNRLQPQLKVVGSTIYKKTWRQKTTPAQWSYSQLVASVPRIKETDCGLQHKGWPTPCANDNRDRGKWKDPVVQRRVKIGKSIELSMMVGVVAPYPEPTGQDLHSSTALIPKREPSQLNPRFSLWLMGFPIEWASCAERVTLSSRKSRQK